MTRVRNRRSSRLNVDRLEQRDVPAAAQLVIDTSQLSSDHVLVKVDAGQPLKNSLIRSAEPLGNDLYDVTLRRGISVPRGMKILGNLPGVQFTEPDYVVSVNVLPNDPSFGSMWGLHNTGQSGGTVDADIDAPEAWDVNTGSGGMVVAVIDTGVNYNHPDLAGNMWHNPAEPLDGIDNDGNGLIDDHYGADYANNDGNPIDDNGHGTHTAGTIGAVGNNGVGVTGVNWDVQIMALKFLGSNGSGSISNAVKCLNYAVAHGAKISNNSWGGGGFSGAMNDAITAAQNAGHIFVAAAGNSASNNDNPLTPNYPSNYSQANVVAVAATDRNNNLASFSNYGATTVDLGAPGVSILSTYGSGYAYADGTSMATPHVAGAAALIWDEHPNWTYTEVIEAIKNTVEPLASLSGRVLTGGLLNLDRAIRYGAPPPTDDEGARVMASTFSPGGSSISAVRLTFNEAINDLSFDIDDVTLTGPGGGVTISDVNPVSATQFDVFFDTQTLAGSYTLVVGPEIFDLAGNDMNQDGVAPNGQTPEDQYTTSYLITTERTFSSTDVNKLIADRTQTTSVLEITDSLTIADINVTLNLSHTYDRDLRIRLVGPDGTTVTLVNRRGGSANNFTNTVLDDEAALSISQGAAPFTGSFRPEQSLTAFDGKSTAGTWRLVIDDLSRFDTGWINAWSITVRY